MQRILVNLTNDCGGNQLNYNSDLSAIGNKMHCYLSFVEWPKAPGL